MIISIFSPFSGLLDVKETLTNQSNALMDELKSHRNAVANMSHTLSLIDIRQSTNQIELSKMLNESLKAIESSEGILEHSIRDYSMNVTKASKNFYTSVQQEMNNSLHEISLKILQEMTTTLHSHQASAMRQFDGLSNATEEILFTTLDSLSAVNATLEAAKDLQRSLPPFALSQQEMNSSLHEISIKCLQEMTNTIQNHHTSAMSLSNSTEEILFTTLDVIRKVNATILKNQHDFTESLIDQIKVMNESNERRHTEDLTALSLTQKSVHNIDVAIIDVTELLQNKAEEMKNLTILKSEQILLQAEIERNQSLSESKSMYQKGKQKLDDK